jgi:hypothetical protein
MRRVDEIFEPLVVGERYLVPCIIDKNFMSMSSYKINDGELIDIKFRVSKQYH